MTDNHSKKLATELITIGLLCLIAISLGPLALCSFLKPGSESVESWFQRSGSLTTVIAVFCQLTINNFLEKIRGGTFAESWSLFHMFSRWQSLISWLATITVIWGAIVWGYGDLLTRMLRH